MGRLAAIDSVSAGTFGTSGTFTVTRTAPGARDAAGGWVEGGETTFSASGSMQPAEGRQLVDLPEGRRADDAKMFFTATKLQTGAQPDFVAVLGESYEVVHEDEYDAFGEVHREYMLVKVTTP